MVKKKKKTIFGLFTVLSFFIFFLAGYAFAAEPATKVQLPNPLGETDIPTIIGRAIQGLTGISGSIALLVFIYGGFLWLTSGGNSEKIKKGKDIMVWAVLGMVVMFGSFIIVRYVLQAVTGAAGA